ncbi:gasdermin-A-like [Sorex araneus]|uniref:gasdermin-A-like n=1 Tax=Sorex araneus TaxID=42254 RepID=UPI002433981A|nr:gasdermin-A-like [Sorex araneus]
MSSLFKRDATSLVRELGRQGELVPVDSLTSAPRLRPFCLVRKKHRCHPWPWDTPVIPTEYSLMDVLEPGSPDPEVSQSQPIHVQKMATGAGTGAPGAGSGPQGQASSKGTCGAKLAVKTLSVSPNTWETLVEQRKVRVPRPPFLQNQEKESLYVVTEAVETVQDSPMQSKMEGSGQSALKDHFLQAHDRSSLPTTQVPTEKAEVVPEGSVMAYRVLRLVIKEDRWGPDSDWPQGKEPGFEFLQQQLGAQLQDLAALPPELRLTLLGALRELLRTPEALQELEDSLEKALDVGELAGLSGPGGLVLSTLQDPAGGLPPSRNRAILCILGALVVLSDTQLNLLAQCLERGLLPQQLELVVSILKTTFDLREETTVPAPLPPGALSSLPEEDAALALSLLESCGLELQGSSHRLTWDPDVLPQLSALYGALEGLQLLASPCAQQAQA